MAKKKSKEVVAESAALPIAEVLPPVEKKARKKKEELKASSVTAIVPETGLVATQVTPVVPLANRKIVPHLLIQEVQSLRNEVDTLKLQVAELLKK